MDFIIIPVKENYVKDFIKIYNGLYALGEKEYATYAWEKVTLAENVTKENPYVKIKIWD